MPRATGSKVHATAGRCTRSPIVKHGVVFEKTFPFSWQVELFPGSRLCSCWKRKKEEHRWVSDSVNMCHPQVSHSATGYKDISIDSRLFLYYWAFVELWAVYLCEPYNGWMRGFLLYWRSGVGKKWGEWVHVLQIIFVALRQTKISCAVFLLFKSYKTKRLLMSQVCVTITSLVRIALEWRWPFVFFMGHLSTSNQSVGVQNSGTEQTNVTSKPLFVISIWMYYIK